MAATFDQPGVVGDRPNLGLGVPADREQQVRQHLPLDAVEDVGLVLVRVGSAVKFRFAGRAADDLGVMPGGDGVGPELLGERPELPELEPGVADDARVRRSTAQVFVGEVVDDLVELGLEVEGVERDVELVRDPPGVAGVDGGAAPLLVVRPGVLLVGVHAGAHEQADHVVPLSLQEHGRRGTVDAATHRKHNSAGHDVRSLGGGAELPPRSSPAEACSGDYTARGELRVD